MELINVIAQCVIAGSGMIGALWVSSRYVDNWQRAFYGLAWSIPGVCAVPLFDLPTTTRGGYAIITTLALATGALSAYMTRKTEQESNYNKLNWVSDKHIRNYDADQASTIRVFWNGPSDDLPMR
mmetsp:Transcript_20289/g.51918  ORF Transcript_20289/g.51918 Transcript_20289/m.51918 type:complete len:125 (-) Transcript_20289:8420-8794(-)